MKRVVSLCLTIHILLFGQMVQAAPAMSFKIEMLNWKEVNQLLPRYTKFTVMDVETGKKFDVQRRAGSHHADVQPLTVKDTKIMKRIYGGNGAGNAVPSLLSIRTNGLQDLCMECRTVLVR
jgi:hypothetical protein